MSTTPSAGIATLDESRAEVLRLTGRNYAKVRHILVQQPRGSETRHSTLGALVSARKHRSLVLYLLLLTVWPVLKNRRDPFEGAFWARLLSVDPGPETKQWPSWSANDVSRAWSDLERRGLITRERHNRAKKISPRREDGAAEWTEPGLTKNDRLQTYFVLPGAFWTENDFAKLSLPAVAMLLIVAAETSAKDEVRLTYGDAADWYGISEASVKKGVHELEVSGLLSRRPEKVKAPLSATGYTTHWWYSLNGAYSFAARAAARQAARTQQRRRQQRAEGKPAARKTQTSGNRARTRKAGAPSMAGKKAKPT